MSLPARHEEWMATDAEYRQAYVRMVESDARIAKKMLREYVEFDSKRLPWWARLFGKR